MKVAAQDDPDYINKCVEGTTVVAEAAEGEDGYAAFAARRVKLRWIGLACRWDNLWKSRGGIVVNGAPREVPESTQWSP